MITPPPLRPGDKIALVSPASAVRDEYVYGAMSKMQDRGYQPILMPYALEHTDGSFAASKGERIVDLIDSLTDPECKAIFCNRGGYGCCQLLPNISPGLVASNPKWLIGFSDISALHALWHHCGVASVHGPMAKHLALHPLDDPSTEALFELLENGGKFDYNVPSNKFNREGRATGIIKGGNLAVLNDLGGTPCDLLADRNNEGSILFLEDINEPIYKVNRMLWRLLLSGGFNNVKGIIFGQFTDYKPDKNYESMEEMLREFIGLPLFPQDIPVVFDFPVGHTETNMPLTEGAEVSINVTESETRLHTL